MKILLVHNDYAKYSGEEAVVDKMAEIYRELGHEVAQLRMSTAGSRDNLKGQIKGFLNGIYSPGGVKAMREALQREKPDVVNVHNLYPFISPAALRECKKAGVPVVMTVHNYRLLCPTGLFTRDNRPCELCLQKGNEWGCVKYNCEKSMVKSIGYAARNAAARWRRDYIDCVDKFSCLTEFQARKLVEGGFDPDKITVIPNSIDLHPGSPVLPLTPPDSPVLPNTPPDSPVLPNTPPDSPVLPNTPPDSPYIAYAGRLSEEKGIRLIMEAARRNPDIPFKLAGAVNRNDPSLKEELEKLPNVTLVGHLSGEALIDFYKNAAFFVMASTWYEGFPMTILEAGRFGKPFIAPAHGGFPEILEGIGILFRPGDAEELQKAVRDLWNDKELIKELGEKTYDKVSRSFSTQNVATRWNSLLNELTLH